MNLRYILGQARGGAENLKAGVTNGWKAARTGHNPVSSMENLPRIFRGGSRIGQAVGKHPGRYAGGAAAAAGAGVGIQAYRNHDPAYTLGLGGKQGKRVIPAKRVNQWLKKEVDPVLPGYSIDMQSGYWHGTREPSRMLTYYGPRKDAPKMRRIADSYRKRFRQDSVLFSEQNPKVRFL